jgi:hypothetical protein
MNMTKDSWQVLLGNNACELIMHVLLHQNLLIVHIHYVCVLYIFSMLFNSVWPSCFSGVGVFMFLQHLCYCAVLCATIRYTCHQACVRLDGERFVAFHITSNSC